MSNFEYALHVAVGAATIALVLLFVPIYIRIICIFLLNRSFRSLECYQIMIQIGVTQCAMAPSWFFTGVAHIIQKDYGLTAAWTYKFNGVLVRAEALLSVLLAMNRLRIICNWTCSRFLQQKTQFLLMYLASLVVWVLCFIPFVVVLTGAADFLVDPKEFLPRYDYSKPYSELLQNFGSNQLIVTSLITLVLYLIIVVYLVYQQCKVGISSEFKKEKVILLHAVVRFVFDFSAAILYNFGKYFLPSSDYASIFVFFTYPFNNLVLPPVLYLTLYKSIREDFFGKKKAVGVSESVFTVNPQNTGSRRE
ncbi:hypothetical protein QR680_009978 [Steinernema hermaphroditum]|uniref:Uncharacterized protein n=1 Tax=Steinernema hermaphroditum TaxID=289476 RepID=A0AA39IMB6_9BILA|nr:hypothetical protein QR680_009978 [Steinernema hermaphroditum]